MNKRDLGSEGESYFDSLCSNAGITANPSVKDQHGWDYIVEFPTENSGMEAMDKKPSPIECKVQVKSTEAKNKKLQVKVSVLYRLVKSHMPAFFCFFEFANTHIPESAYLLHIDFDMIDTVLKRVRKLEAEGKADKLHKHSITIKYDNTHKFSHTSGHEFQELIQSYIPGGLDKYTTAKLVHLEKSGYTTESARMKITFPAAKVVDRLLDLELGLIDSVPFEKVDAVSVRYEIELPDNQLSSIGSGKISLPEEKPIDGVLFFKESKLSPPVEFKAAITLPRLFKSAFADTLTFRARTTCFDLVVKRSIPKFTYTWKSDKVLTISELRNYAWVLYKVNSGKSLYTGLEIHSPSQAFNFGQTSATMHQTNGSVYKDFFELVEQAIFICRKLDINTDRVLLSMDDLYAFQKPIRNIYIFLHHSPDTFTLSCGVKSNALEISAFPPVAFTFTLASRLGNICLAIVGAMLSNSKNGEVRNKMYEFQANDIKIEQKYVGSFEEISAIDLNEQEDFLKHSLENQGYEVVSLNRSNSD